MEKAWREIVLKIAFWKLEPPIIKNEVFDLKKDENDNVSVSSCTNKKKLAKLNLDGLKQKCTELNLQTDGTKNELIERILNADI